MYKIINAFRCMRNSRVFFKSLLIMKFIIILLTASILQVSAATYAQQISISVKEAPLQQVFKQIRKQSGYNILYDSDMLSNAKPVSISLNKASLDEVLKACFANQPLSYVINQTTVIVRSKPAPPVIAKQEVIVTGKVTDEKGTVLPGVSIKIKGSTAGTVTDQAGTWSLKLPAGNETLVFSSIGYAVQEIPAAGRTRIDVVLKEVQSALDEIVVVGYVLRKELM